MAFPNIKSLDAWCRLHNAAITPKSVPDLVKEIRFTIWFFNKDDYAVGRC